MRILVVWFAVLAFSQTAAAADLGPLRGGEYEEPVRACCWAGFYGGGQVGYSTAGADFTGTLTPLINASLDSTVIQQDQTTLGQHLQISPQSSLKANLVGSSFGAFVGYNWQWEDAVTGFEINYSRSSVSGSTSALLGGSFRDSANLTAGHHYQYSVAVDAAASAHITDLATFRFRGGWAAGRFLPYAFAAFAVGRVDVTRSVTGSYAAIDVPDSGTTATVNLACPPDAVCPAPVASEVETRKGAIAYGAAAGLGIDIALLRNLFVRGEWEYVQFAPLYGDHLHISTVRTGVGLKF